jgi:hypothetical protein
MQLTHCEARMNGNVKYEEKSAELAAEVIKASRDKAI